MEKSEIKCPHCDKDDSETIKEDTLSFGGKLEVRKCKNCKQEFKRFVS